jgi:hypothetical protein
VKAYCFEKQLNCCEVRNVGDDDDEEEDDEEEDGEE